MENGRTGKAMDDDTLSRIRTAINAEIAELHCNMGKHSKEVQTNAIMMVEGLQMALRIIREVEEENDEETDKNNPLVGNRNE